MASLLNAKFWKKAYLLEFKKDGVLKDAFTFSVPPESEDFSFPQRKNETKTFGGGVVSDYGNDFVQISLSGSTINQEVKLIYKSKLGAAEMTGEEEIFYLRDLLKKYGSAENLQGKEVYLYSLNGGGKYVKNNPKWWKIYVGQLDITRSKDKPFCYNYKFTATGNPEVNSKPGLISQFIESWQTKFEGFISVLNTGADVLQSLGGGFLTDLSNLINTLKQQVVSLNSAVSNYADVLNGIIDQTEGLVLDSVSLGDKVLWSGLRYYPTLVADVWNNCLDVKNTVNQIYELCSNIGDEYFSQSWWQQVKETFDDSVSNEEIADSYSSTGHEIEVAANALVAIASKILDSWNVAINPGDKDEDDEIVIVYGYKVVAITEAETSWDQLALDFYGDSSLSYILSTVNSDKETLTPGTKIIVPQLKFSESSFNNEVYNSPDVKDNYGIDISVAKGDLTIINNDLMVISGTENLKQALMNRYLTMIGARVRVEVYGIQVSIGNDVEASSALIQASVHQTTVEDPRVESVDNISFEGKGDTLQVVVDYVDKNGEKGNVGGTI